VEEGGLVWKLGVRRETVLRLFVKQKKRRVGCAGTEAFVTTAIPSRVNRVHLGGGLICIEDQEEK